MIPKTINYCWFGDKPLSELAQKCIKSWKKYCPEYEIRRWTEKDIDFNNSKYMKECYEKKAWGFVPDVARLQIIYLNGGIYFDTDVELIKPIDNLLDDHGFLGFESKDAVNLGQGFGAEKGNALIKRLLEEYDGLHFINEDGSLNRLPSPQIQTMTLRKLGLKLNNEKQKIMGVNVYPSDYFTGIDFNTGLSNRTKNTYSIHHFDGSWLSDSEKEYDKLRWKTFKKYGHVMGKYIWFMKQIQIQANKEGYVSATTLAMRKLLRNGKS